MESLPQAQSNSCLQWVCRPQLHKYGEIKDKVDFLVFYILQQKIFCNLAIIQVALYLQYTQSAELVNCSFQDNLATTLVVNNTNITLAGNTEFTRNLHALWW